MPRVIEYSVYKPPNKKYVLPALGYEDLLHNTTKGYTITDDNGEPEEQWIDSNNITLLYNAKLS